MMIFQTKKDVWLGFLFWIPSLLLIWAFIDSVTNRDWLAIVLLPIVIILLLLIWFRTYYKIEDHLLIIVSGPFKQQIDIHDISSLRYTKGILAAPSLSLERIEINTTKFETVQISPKKQAAFIQALREIQPTIKMKHI